MNTQKTATYKLLTLNTQHATPSENYFSKRTQGSTMPFKNIIGHRILFFLFFLPLLSLPGCSVYVEEIELPVKEPPIVVHAYLYAGMEEITVSVMYARNIGGGGNRLEQQPVRNAVVSIRSELHPPQILTLDEATGFYTAPTTNLPVVAGVEYYLLIGHQDYKPIEGRVRVPVGHNRFFADLVKLEIIGHRKTLRFDARIEDEPGKRNFYRFFGFLEGETICGSAPETRTEPFSRDIFKFVPLQSDELRDGQVLLFPGVDLELNAPQFPTPCHNRIDHLRLRLFFLEEQTYKYLQSVIDFMEAIDNPFLTPQSPVTNLTNAFGVFGAYAMVEKIVPAAEFIQP